MPVEELRRPTGEHFFVGRRSYDLEKPDDAWLCPPLGPKLYIFRRLEQEVISDSERLAS